MERVVGSRTPARSNVCTATVSASVAVVVATPGASPVTETVRAHLLTSALKSTL